MEQTASFGYWVRRRRKALDLTQARLAAQVGVAVASVRKWEADERRPAPDVAARLAQVLGLPPAEHERFVQVARAERAADTLPLTTQPVEPETSPGNLPVWRDPLIGRAAEVATVRAVLGRCEVGLVTLTGPGGIGKTRLAWQVAAEVRPAFPDGAWVVELAPVRDPVRVAATIARVLGVTETAGPAPDATLQRWLRERQLLLVLDNCEHLDGVALLVAELLRAASGLKVLATSRMPLHLRGEHEFVVGPLVVPHPRQLPTADDLCQVPAVVLFARRAQAVQPAFALTTANASVIAEICRRLDGLPLALELAAARLKVLTLPRLLARLEHRLQLLTDGARDLPPRQQTLRATMEWSYQLLEPVEQQLFARLAVFAGGWTLEAAEAVCKAAQEPCGDVLDGLASLLDKGLLVRQPDVEGEPRFTMLETIREYALERLGAAGEAKISRERHATYCLALAEQVEPQLMCGARIAWLQRLEVEHDNLRAALAWSLREEAPGETAARLAGALTWFWYLRRYSTEAYAWFSRVLAHFEPTGGRASLRTWARALYGMSFFSVGRHPDPTYTRSILEQSVAISRRVGDTRGLILALIRLGTEETRSGAPGAARARLDESSALARELGDPWSLGMALGYAGRLAVDDGAYGRAAGLYEEGLALARQGHDEWLIAFHLEGLADVAAAWQRPEQGATLYAAARPGYQGVGDKLGVVSCLLGQARAAAAQGQTAHGMTLYQESLVLLRAMGSAKWVYMEALEGMAGLVAACEEQPAGARRAARLFGAAEALREAVGAPVPLPVRARYAEDVATTRAQLDEATFRATWAKGRAMTVEEAVAHALGAYSNA